MRDDRGKLSRYRDTVKFALCIPSKGLSFIFFVSISILRNPQTNTTNKTIGWLLQKAAIFFLVVEERFCNFGYHVIFVVFEKASITADKEKFLEMILFQEENEYMYTEKARSSDVHKIGDLFAFKVNLNTICVESQVHMLVKINMKSTLSTHTAFSLHTQHSPYTHIILLTHTAFSLYTHSILSTHRILSLPMLPPFTPIGKAKQITASQDHYKYLVFLINL